MAPTSNCSVFSRRAPVVEPGDGRARRGGRRRATTWVALDTALRWLTLDGAALFLADRLAGKLLAAEDSTLDAGRWRWKFIFAETSQGITWGPPPRRGRKSRQIPFPRHYEP